MNEKERIIRCVEDFLKRRYELRYNVVKGVTEFRVNDLRFKQWSPLTDRDLKSIVVEEMKEGGESWTNDIRNYIEDFARRLPTSYTRWPEYFHRWFLAMVAQALNINKDYGNSMVPLLIGEQEQLVAELFEPTELHKIEDFWTITGIQNEMRKHMKESDIPNLKTLGKIIKLLRWRKNKRNGTTGYYLRLRIN